MKKILGISLVAMMSVTAANAEIASKGYVDAKDNDIKTNIIGTSTNFVEGITSSTVKGAINELYNAANGSNGLASRVTTLESDVKMDSASSRTGGYSANDKVDAALANVDSALATAQSDITTLNGNASTTGSVDQKIATAVGGLDAAGADGGDSGFVISVSETDGVITATKGDVGAAKITGYAVDAAQEASPVAATDTLNAALGKLQRQINDSNTGVGNLDGALGTGDVASGNVVTQVTQADGLVTVTHGNAVNAVASATSDSSTGNVITGISLNSDGKTIDFQKGITALQASDLTNSTTATTGQVVTAISMTNGVLSQTTADPLTNAAYELQAAGVGAGKYALTAIVNGSNEVTGYKWELIERAPAGE